MKTLELNQLEVFNGGGVGSTISGACAAYGIALAVKWLVVSPPVSVGLAVGCGINALGTGKGWW